MNQANLSCHTMFVCVLIVKREKKKRCSNSQSHKSKTVISLRVFVCLFFLIRAFLDQVILVRVSNRVLCRKEYKTFIFSEMFFFFFSFFLSDNSNLPEQSVGAERTISADASLRLHVRLLIFSQTQYVMKYWHVVFVIYLASVSESWHRLCLCEQVCVSVSVRTGLSLDWEYFCCSLFGLGIIFSNRFVRIRVLN